VKITIFVEGGGKGALRSECRQAFKQLFDRAGFEKRSPKVVPCGSRREAFDDFCHELSLDKQGEFPMLLVDSEDAVTKPVWQHLRERQGDQWEQPEDATDDHAHLMVQCMESWLIADKDNLETYFGNGFVVSRLPPGTNVEVISKAAVFAGLRAATRDTTPKGEYSKGTHSFKILALTDPFKVRRASAHANRFFDTLEKYTNS
jgi:hypothetical protein